MRFFNELKRRNVFRVGIAYAVGAWVMLQIVDLVLENIAAPDWVMQVFMLALAIGFPIAIIISWAFEVTPDGIKRETDVDRSQSIASGTGHKLDRIIIAFLAIAVVFLIINPFKDDPQTTAGSTPAPSDVTAVTTATEATVIERDKSVAVLPFAFRSSNADDEFFAEGMHDDLLTQLAKIGSLKVISRTSVMEYKDTTKKIPQIAKELGVATIVEGGVQRSGSRIRFNAQLIDAQTDQHLWAETYNRELTAENLFDIQAEIARAIAQALHAALSPEEEVRIDQPLTKNLAAWESYQRAIRMVQSQSEQAIRAGISEINRTLELDPGFAAAWSLKAILLLQKYWFYDTDSATRDSALEAIQQGRTIDPTLAELDLAEGYYYYWGFRNYEKALPFMKRASAALPNNSRVHQARAYVLRRMGRWEDALTAFRRTKELDPRSSTTWVDIGETLSGLRRFSEARQASSEAQLLDSDSPINFWLLASLDLNETGDIKSSTHFLHLVASPYPDAQFETWRSSLYLDDYDAALQDVINWPESFLNAKDRRVTRSLLNGLTYLYAGNVEKSQPLLLEAKLDFESLLNNDPDDFPITRSLCFITGGLRDLQAAKKYCTDSLSLAPNDAFDLGLFLFDAAAGLALAGDAAGSAKLVKDMLDGEAGPTIYPVIYHPAFDGIRETPAYIELLAEYGPETP